MQKKQTQKGQISCSLKNERPKLVAQKEKQKQNIEEQRTLMAMIEKRKTDFWSHNNLIRNIIEGKGKKGKGKERKSKT